MSNRDVPRVLVIGLGNDHRGDDRAGLVVARCVRRTATEAGIDVREHHGEPTGLLEAWRRRETVVLIDTMHSGLAAGTISRFDATRRPVPFRSRQSASTHALALEDAIELGRALERLPGRLLVYAVEGQAFGPGDELSDEVTAAVPMLAATVVGEAILLAACKRHTSTANAIDREQSKRSGFSRMLHSREEHR